MLSSYLKAFRFPFHICHICPLTFFMIAYEILKSWGRERERGGVGGRERGRRWRWCKGRRVGEVAGGLLCGVGAAGGLYVVDPQFSLHCVQFLP